LSHTKKQKPQYCLSAGTYSQVLNVFAESGKVLLLLPSGTRKFFSFFSVCILGRVSNILKNRFVTGKAGVNLNLGVRPSVRGNAMNPIDHPHGGRAKTNKPEVSP